MNSNNIIFYIPNGAGRRGCGMIFQNILPFSLVRRNARGEYS